MANNHQIIPVTPSYLEYCLQKQFEDKIAALQSEKDELNQKLEEAHTNTAAMK